MKRELKIAGGVILFLAFIALPSASAGVIYNNGGPNTDSGYSIQGAHWTGDDFFLPAGGTIASVGFYFQNYFGITGWNQQVSYSIVGDSSGPFGSVLASGAGLNVAPVDSGLPWCCGGNAWLVTFDLQTPFSALGSTRYWLELTGAGSTNGDSWWVTANDNSTPVGFTDSHPQGHQFAFYLSDTTSGGVGSVPEPGSMLLTGIGALAILAFRRRK